ncbi:unnamed protein product [Heterobilharzia americana]|nr:unnamed protein product [Heterobilharzia americana]
MEAFKTFDREGQGFISAAEMRHVLTGYGERLEDEQVDLIVKLIDLREDLEGNIKYEVSQCGKEETFSAISKTLNP